MTVLSQTLYGSVQTNSVGSGQGAWSNPGFTTGIPNGQRASSSKGPTAGAIPGQAQMFVQNFGFALPPCFIRGIAASLWAGNTGTAGTTIVGSFALALNGAQFGSVKSTTFPAPSNVPRQDYGGSTDLWGATLTQAVVNDVTFGLRSSFTCTPGVTGSGKTVRLEMDGVEMTVYYEPIIFPNRFKMML